MTIDELREGPSCGLSLDKYKASERCGILSSKNLEKKLYLGGQDVVSRYVWILQVRGFVKAV
jgi:hypothetical protein